MWRCCCESGLEEPVHHHLVVDKLAQREPLVVVELFHVVKDREEARGDARLVEILHAVAQYRRHGAERRGKQRVDVAVAEFGGVGAVVDERLEDEVGDVRNAVGHLVEVDHVLVFAGEQVRARADVIRGRIHLRIRGQYLEREHLLDVVLAPHAVALELELYFVVVVRSGKREIRDRLRHQDVIRRQAAELLDAAEREREVLRRKHHVLLRGDGGLVLFHGHVPA